MNLIEEIDDTFENENQELGYVLCKRWPRIRAALKAAQEMDTEIMRRKDYQPSRIPKLNEAQRKFRKAMNGDAVSRETP